MPVFSYRLDNGAVIKVEAPNAEAAAPKLQREFERLTPPADESGWSPKAIGRGFMRGLEQLNQGITAGWWDEATAGLEALGGDKSKPYMERYRDNMQENRNDLRVGAADNPYAAAINETAGGALSALATGGTSAPYQTTGRLATTGALWGGAEGAGKSETSGGSGLEQAQQIAGDTLKGAVVGAATNTALGHLMQGKNPNPVDAPVEARRLKGKAQGVYQELLEDNPPVPGFADKADEIIKGAELRGIGKYGDPVLYQRIKQIKKTIKAAQKEGREVNYRDVNTLIKSFQNAAKTSNETQRAAAMWGREQLYEALPGEFADARRVADGMYRRAKRSQAISGAIDDAALATGRSGVGGNTMNPQRQAISKLITANEKKPYFTPSEIQMMEEFVKGGDLENLLRRLAVISPTRTSIVPIILGSLGLNQLGQTGAGSAGLGTAALLGMAGAGGYAAQKGGEALQRDALQALQQKILTGDAPATIPGIVRSGTRRAAGMTGGAAADYDPGFYPENLLEMIK